MPHTYGFVERFGRWCQDHGVDFGVTRWIRQDGSFMSLDEWCFAFKTLPSRAFGMSGCTVKWKQQPLEKFIRTEPRVQAVHQAGGRVERWIGYDADEPRRFARMAEKTRDDPLYHWRAPLIEWGFGRTQCVDAIRNAGLPDPGKSSCWMCPSLKKHEILQLGRQYPDLAAHAVRMEHNAEGMTAVKGLGRRFAWEDVLAGQTCEPDAVEAACGCHDGTDERGED
jgi:hypothetical protein